MQQDLYVLIDIGGTAIKSGVATLDGTLLERNEMPTEAKPTEAQLEAAKQSGTEIDSSKFGGPGIVSKVFLCH